jgi:hypothetical protein
MFSLASTNASTTPLINSITFSEDYPSSGTFTSSVIDGVTTQDWQQLTADAIPPLGTTIAYAVRTGADDAIGSTWNDWSNVESDGTINTVNNRFIQYKITFNTTDTSVTPTVNSITITSVDATTSATTNISSTTTPTPTASSQVAAATSTSNTTGTLPTTGTNLYLYRIILLTISLLSTTTLLYLYRKRFD